MIERLRPEYDQSWLFFAFIGGLLVFASIRLVYAVIFDRDKTRLFSRESTSSDKSDNKSYIGYRLLVLLAFSYTVTIIFALLANSLSDRFVSTVKEFGVIFLVVLSLMTLKMVIDYLLFWIFDLGDSFRGMLVKNVSIRLSLGFYMIILLFLAHYSGLWDALINSNTLIVLFLVYIVFNIAVMADFFAYKVRYFFYFIFYLCTVELCPLLIIWSSFGQTIN